MTVVDSSRIALDGSELQDIFSVLAGEIGCNEFGVNTVLHKVGLEFASVPEKGLGLGHSKRDQSDRG
jgi:hypothetical protein